MRESGAGGRARRILPQVGPRELQAAAAVYVRRRDPEIAGGQAPPAQTGGGRVPARRARSSQQTGSENMSDTDARLQNLGGFPVEIDAGRAPPGSLPDRPPPNVIALPRPHP